jgi:hypothetical protein
MSFPSRFARVGRGLSIPLTRQNGDFSTETGIDLIQSNFELTLLTNSSSGYGRGDLRWNGAWGTRLYLLRNKSRSPIFFARLQRYVLEGAAQHPEIRVVSISTDQPAPRSRELVVNVTWTLANPASLGSGVSDNVLRTSTVTVT